MEDFVVWPRLPSSHGGRFHDNEEPAPTYGDLKRSNSVASTASGTLPRKRASTYTPSNRLSTATTIHGDDASSIAGGPALSKTGRLRRAGRTASGKFSVHSITSADEPPTVPRKGSIHTFRHEDRLSRRGSPASARSEYLSGVHVERFTYRDAVP